MGESGTSTRAKAARIAAGSGAILSLGASLVATAGPAGAATFNVTTTADAGAGSLRQAIADANLAVGADTITFAPGLGTIALTTGEIDIAEDLTIIDPEGDVTVDAGGTSRIFYMVGAGAVTISGLTLTDGSAGSGGGAVMVLDTDFTLVDSTISDSSTGGDGGGLYVSDGTLTVTGSTFTDNYASNDGGGLHVDEAETVTITDSTFTGNDASSDGGGISIYDFSDATLEVTLTGVTATGNSAPNDQGGAMAIQGLYDAALVITGSTFTGNDGDSGGGVTLFALDNSTVAISGTEISGNTAYDIGGGLYLSDNDSGTEVTILTSTFDGNEVTGGEGPGTGGGIGITNSSTVSIAESTVSNNTADIGGGVFSEGTVLSVTNSTVSGNSADDGGGGMAIYGVVDTDISISHSTISGNTAAYGGGLMLAGYGTASLDHNILDGNVAAQPAPQAAGPTFDEFGSALFVLTGRDTVQEQALDSITLTNNLVNGTIAGVVVDGGGNLFDLPANLGPLANNGGPTATHDLLAGSAALDAGSAAFAAPPATDQRGLPRVANARIDIGAVEVQVQVPVEPEPEPAPPAAPVPADPTFTG